MAEYIRNQDGFKGRKFQLVGIKADGSTRGIRHLSDSKGSVDKIISGCVGDTLDVFGKISCSFDCSLFKITCSIVFLPGQLKLLKQTTTSGCCPS